mmetsp:Transcript_17013/g.32198  ORF Transcript_17013/g.32198 Transcript_17013/m.32198 type:complete len:244 (+) Transcript_17013:1456-2187(+)
MIVKISRLVIGISIICSASFSNFSFVILFNIAFTFFSVTVTIFVSLTGIQRFSLLTSGFGGGPSKSSIYPPRPRPPRPPLPRPLPLPPFGGVLALAHCSPSPCFFRCPWFGILSLPHCPELLPPPTPLPPRWTRVTLISCKSFGLQQQISKSLNLSNSSLVNTRRFPLTCWLLEGTGETFSARKPPPGLSAPPGRNPPPGRKPPPGLNAPPPPLPPGRSDCVNIEELIGASDSEKVFSLSAGI